MAFNEFQTQQLSFDVRQAAEKRKQLKFPQFSYRSQRKEN
jgi:hypothetical protein